MNDHERAIRDMLLARAADITAGPSAQWQTGGSSAPTARGIDLTRKRPSARWLIAATVVAVVVLAGGAVGIHLWTVGQSDGLPANPGPSAGLTPPPPTTAPSTTAPSTTAPGTTATGPRARPVPIACSVPLPAPWKQALSAPGSAFGAYSARAMGIAADGTVLVARDFGQGKPRDLLLVRPDGQQTVAFTVDDPQHRDIQSAYLVGDHLVVSVGSAPRAPKGEVPGSSPLPNVHTIVVINRTTGERQVIASVGDRSSTAVGASAGSETTIDSAVVIGHVVYWDVHGSYSDPAGTIQSYDLATGVTRTAYSGDNVRFFAGAEVSAAGITIDQALVVRSALPQPVVAAVPEQYRPSVQTDGSAYAWVAGPDRIGWWRPGLASPAYADLSAPMDESPLPNMLAVAGSMVVVRGSLLLDMTTFAASTLPTTVQPIVRAGGTTLVNLHRAGQGHWDQDGYWVDASVRITTADLASLPPLGCGG